jgi:HEAT repeat protein
MKQGGEPSMLCAISLTVPKRYRYSWGLKMEHTGNLWKGWPLEYWIEALQDPDDEARWGAIDALRHIADPSQTIPLFVRSLSDRYWRARSLAVHALYDMAFEVKFLPLLSQAVTPLANALSDSRSDICLQAAWTLELLGPAAQAALPQLQEAVKRGDDELRNAASEAILRVTGTLPVKRFPGEWE